MLGHEWRDNKHIFLQGVHLNVLTSIKRIINLDHQRTLGGPFCAKQTFKTKGFFLMWKDICINEEKINMIQDQKKEDCLSMIAFQQNIDIQTK